LLDLDLTVCFYPILGSYEEAEIFYLFSYGAHKENNSGR